MFPVVQGRKHCLSEFPAAETYNSHRFWGYKHAREWWRRTMVKYLESNFYQHI